MGAGGHGQRKGGGAAREAPDRRLASPDYDEQRDVWRRQARGVVGTAGAT